MDDIVKAALLKWPHVPHCHDWLALDARGHWYMRDDQAQAAGPFPQVKGSRITHDKLLAFIHRNYAADAHGAWYFQNGPQRVYVSLEAAPWVWRLHRQASPGAPQVQAHTGTWATPRAVWLDEQGRAFLDTELGFGLVHTLDTGLLAEALGEALEAALAGRPTSLPLGAPAAAEAHTVHSAWGPVRPLAFAQMPGRFGYQLHPRPG
jgi:hypothetical protein